MESGMPEFVDTDEGWINIDHVETITEKTHDGIRRATFYDAASRRMGGKAMWDPFEHNGHIIPAQPDAYGVVIGNDDGPDPWVQRIPIVGWRITSCIQYAVPVCPWPTEGCCMLIPTGDGKWMWQDNAIYDTLEAAVESWKREKTPA